jgi:hypothetical protein
MKPVVVSAILYGLVGAACLTGCADHPGNHQAVRAEQSGSAMPSTLSAPAVKHHEVNAAGSQKAETSRRNPPGAIQGETDTNPSVENEYDVDTSE